MGESLRSYEETKSVSSQGVVGNPFFKEAILKLKRLHEQYRLSGLMAKTEMLLDLTYDLQSNDGVIGFNIYGQNGRVTISRHTFNTVNPILEIAATWGTSSESGESSRLNANWDFQSGKVADLAVVRQAFLEGEVVSDKRFTTSALSPEYTGGPNTLSVTQVYSDVDRLTGWTIGEAYRRRLDS